MKRSPLRLAALALAFVVAASGCSEFESRITNPNEGEPLFDVFLQVPGGQAGGNVAADPDFSVQLDDDQGNTLSFNTGQIVVREMELGRTTGECVDSEAGQDEDDGDACTEVTVTPQILSLPVDRGEVQIVNRLPVEAGTYDRLEFDIHVTTAEDQQVIGSNPRLQDESVQLQGAYNGSSFSVRLDPEGPVNLDFGQTIEAEPGATSRITLIVEMDGWFRRDDGSLIDPATLADDPALEDRVEGQIMSSFSIQPGPPQ